MMSNVCYYNNTIPTLHEQLTHLENIQKYEVDHPLRKQRCELAKDNTKYGMLIKHNSSCTLSYTEKLNTTVLYCHQQQLRIFQVKDSLYH